MVTNLQETRVQSLGWEDPLEKGMAIHSSILAWRIPWTEKPGGLQFVGSQRVSHDWVIHTHTHRHTHSWRASEIWWLSSQWRTSWRRKDVCGCSLPVPKKKLGRQVRSVWKILCGICHGIWQQFFFSVSLEPLTMALEFHFSIGQYNHIKF